MWLDALVMLSFAAIYVLVARLYKLFAARGWRQPRTALRARLVYVPAEDRRRELMIIYAEATASAAPPTAKEAADLIARAQAGLRLVR